MDKAALRMSRKMDRCLQALVELERVMTVERQKHWLSSVLGRLLTVSNYLAEVSGNDRIAPPSAADDC